MSNITIISDQWYCLTEPERALAKAMALNSILSLGVGYIAQSTGDTMFTAVRGSDWQVYRDQWLANWQVDMETLTFEGIEIDCYVTRNEWLLGVNLCEDCPDSVPCRCLEATGFPPC